MRYKQILKQNPLFSCLDDAELESVVRIAEPRSYPKGRFPIRAGDTSSALFIVLAGRATAVSYNGKERIVLNTFLPGDYFGEMSFVDGEPRCASVETEEYTEVLVIPRERFRERFSNRTGIQDALLKGLLQKLRRATSEVHKLIEVISNQELHDAHIEVIDRLVRAAEFKDECTGGHILRIGQYSRLIAENIGLSPKKTEDIFHAAPMHDIGKIGIPETILLKPGRLTQEEFDVIKTHPTIGANILANPRSDLLKCAKNIALCHHEKFNGKGYPGSLKGFKIPLEARIVAIVDAFDAITSDRPYEKAVPPEEAMDRLQRDRGEHFDPEFLDAFIDRMEEVKKIVARRRAEEECVEDGAEDCDNTDCKPGDG